ncbi:MAG: polysaccharide deacetylase family protein [Clostridiales bacterium]|jgi:probable sporulation protein (polysaccharide deacetylase family)|nr:polysaccharide deacetylase family protein [Clostridiales bacterium]
MDKKARFFRNVIANLILSSVVVFMLVFTFTDNSVPIQGKEAPVYKGDSQTAVSLMVNVYWGSEYVEPMLNIFAAHGVKTTFFVGGMWAAENGELLKKIYDAGHELGNHGYFHKDHKALSEKANREEIEVTHKMVKSIVGVDMSLFAPPSGSFGPAAIKAAADLGYKTVMWTADTIDWRDRDSALIYERATRNLSGGNLILTHPTEQTAAALPKIIAAIKEQNLTVATVSEVL